MKRVVDLLWAHGVYSILDLHQDVLSPRLCGEGAPLWVNATPAALGGLLHVRRPDVADVAPPHSRHVLAPRGSPPEG